MHAWLEWYPPVGVFIAILGLLGVLVPLLRDLTNISREEKAAWTALMFILVGLEVRSIYLDRNAHDREQSAARAEQLRQFGKIAEGINTTATTNQGHFDATMSSMKSLLKTTQATKKNTEPEAYITFSNFGVDQSSLPMAPNHQLRFNVWMENKGSEDAINVEQDGKIFLGKASDPQGEGEKFSREFEKWWKHPTDRPYGHWRTPVYAAGDKQGFFTIDAPQLTDDDIRQIRSNPNTLTFYTFIRFVYSDHSGQWAHDRCEWMQDPARNFNVSRPCLVNYKPRYKAK